MPGPSRQLLLHAYPELRLDGRPLPLPLKRALALLVVLSELARKVARAQVAGLLWPDAARDVGRARLRRLVHQTNLALAADAVVGDADALWLGDADWTSDVQQARQAARQLVAAPAAEDAGEALERLLRPGTHQMLEGFSFGSDTFDDWLAERRTELQQLVVRALQRGGEHLLQGGQAQRVAQVAQRLTALDPLADGGHALLLRAHAQRGDLAALESAYLDFAALLRAELGVRPSPAVEALYEDLRRQVLEPRPTRPGDTAAAASPTMAPPIRYADSEDGAVAYLELGQGPETLVILFGIWSHLELAWDQPTIRRVLLALSRQARVVLIDRRGVGLSERLAPDLSVEAGVSDIEAVRRALGAARIWLFGSSAGGAIAIDYAATHRDTVGGLILYAAKARGAWAPDYPWSPTTEQLQAWAAHLHAHWGQATSLADFAPSLADDPAARDWWARMIRQAVSRNTLPTLMREFVRMDVRHRLPQVQVPALVLQREGDRIVRAGTATYLARHIRGARLRLLPGEDHHLWAGDADAVVAEIERFMQDSTRKDTAG